MNSKKTPKTVRPIITVVRRAPKDTHRVATHSDPRPREEDPWERYDRAYGVADPFISPPVLVADPSTDQPSEEGVTSQLPQGTFSAESVLPRGVFDDIEFALPEALGNKYHDIRFWKEGGTRLIFTAYWGPQDEKRIIKVDKVPATITSPRSQRNVARGNITENDMHTLASIPHAEQHGLMRLLDYGDLSMHGRGKIVVEPYFPSQSLEDRITSDGAFSLNEAKERFGKIFRAAQYFVNTTGRLHRDIKPDNILIGTGSASGDIRITDFANARNADEIDTKFMPTVGSAATNDWQLYSTLTGNETAYTEQSEVFAYGMSYAFARLGKRFVDIDPDARTAVALDTGESLLNSLGKMDAGKYEAAVSRALASLPRKERAFVHKAITSNLAERYESLDELVSAFDKMHEPGFIKKMTKGWRGFAWGGVIAANLLGIGGYWAMSERDGVNAEKTAQLVREAEKFDVAAEWDGFHAELKNNLVQLNVRATAGNSKENWSEWPTEAYVHTYAGEGIDVSVNIQQLPRNRGKGVIEQYSGSPSFKTRAYIEGIPFEARTSEDVVLTFLSRGGIAAKEGIKNDFWLTARHPDTSTEYSDGAGGWGMYGSSRLSIPKTAPEGTYILAVEIYEPPQVDIDRNEPETRKINYEKPGAILARQRVPIVIGNPEGSIDLSMVHFREIGGPEFSLRDLAKIDPRASGVPMSNRNVTVEIRVPEEDYVYTTDNKRSYSSFRMELPPSSPSGPESLSPRTLEFTLRDPATNNVLLYTALPIQRTFTVHNKYTDRDEYQWTLGRWDKSASEFLVGRRPGIDYNAIEQERVNDKK